MAMLGLWSAKRGPWKSILVPALVVSCWFGSSLSLVGCNRNPECERARLKLHREWESIYHAATERKLAGVDEANWSTVESKADTLQSAFATEQITWDSANNAKQAIVSMLPTLTTDTEIKMEVFKASVMEAVQDHEAFAGQCR